MKNFPENFRKVFTESTARKFWKYFKLESSHGNSKNAWQQTENRYNLNKLYCIYLKILTFVCFNEFNSVDLPDYTTATNTQCTTNSGHFYFIFIVLGKLLKFLVHKNYFQGVEPLSAWNCDQICFYFAQG